MRTWAAASCLLLAATAAVAEQAHIVFAPGLPAGIVDVSTWEVVAGDFDTPSLRGGYRFYVNPARQLLYQVMRYRTSNQADRQLGAERVAYVRNPGSHEPIVCWERQPAGSSPEWRALVPGTSEYVVEMGTLMGVLAGAAGAARER